MDMPTYVEQSVEVPGNKLKDIEINSKISAAKKEHLETKQKPSTTTGFDCFSFLITDSTKKYTKLADIS